MKKIFWGLALLVLAGCVSHSNLSDLRVTESTPNNIRIISNVFGLRTDATDRAKQSLAADHCSKYGKYYFFYAYDFNSNGANYVCGTSPRGGELLFTNYVYGAQTQATNVNDNKKTCKEFGYKDGTDKFADCMLELTKLSSRQNQQPPTTNNGVADAMREANQIERGKVLLDLSKRLNPPAQPSINCTTTAFGNILNTNCK